MVSDPHLLSIREALAAYVASLPVTEDGHPTQAEKDALLEALTTPREEPIA